MSVPTLQVAVTAPTSARPGAAFGVNVDFTDAAARTVTLAATATTPTGVTATADTTVQVGEEVTVTLSSPDHGVGITETAPGVFQVTCN